MSHRSCLAIFLMFAALGARADTVSLFLKLGGNDVDGESRFTSLGRQNSIDCYSFDLQAALAVSAATGAATGRRTYEPLKFVKKIDKSSVLIWKALTQNELGEATFKFYRPNPSGTGAEQHYYTVRLTQVRISGFRQFTPQADDPKSVGFAVWEEVEVSFGAIACTYEIGGIQHEDSLRGGGPPVRRVPPPSEPTGPTAILQGRPDRYDTNRTIGRPPPRLRASA